MLRVAFAWYVQHLVPWSCLCVWQGQHVDSLVSASARLVAAGPQLLSRGAKFGAHLSSQLNSIISSRTNQFSQLSLQTSTHSTHLTRLTHLTSHTSTISFNSSHQLTSHNSSHIINLTQLTQLTSHTSAHPTQLTQLNCSWSCFCMAGAAL